MKLITVLTAHQLADALLVLIAKHGSTEKVIDVIAKEKGEKA